MFQWINQNWPSQLDTVEKILWFILVYLVILFIISIFLWFAIGLVNSENDTFGQVFLTALIIVILMAIVHLLILSWIVLIIDLLIIWIMISARHKTGFVGAIIVTILAVILFIITIYIIAMTFGYTIYVFAA